MEKSQTLNVISTPNIEGNVSSCKTEVVTIQQATRPSLFYTTSVSYATNNCTGHTDTYEGWNIVPGWGFLILLAGITTLVCIGRVVWKLTEKN